MSRRKYRRYNEEPRDIFDYNKYDMSLDQKKQYLRKIVERANKRITRINKAGVYSHALKLAQLELRRVNRKRFSYKSPKTEFAIDREIAMTESFLNMESSYVKNIKLIQDKAFTKLINKLQKKGYDQLAKVNRNDFYRFLSSQEFKDMSNRYGSGWVVEDIAMHVESNKKLDIDELMDTYADFMEQELPLEALQEMRSGSIANYAQYREKLSKQRRS